MKYLKLLFYPILLLVVQFIIIFVFTLIFNSTTTLEINTLEYNQQLSMFLNNYKLFTTLIIAIIIIPLVINKIDKPYDKPKNILKLIIMGMSFSLTFNLLLFSLNKLFNFTNLFDDSSTNIIITLICTGIIGPILEELIFRGAVYSNLKKFTNTTKAMIITGLLFGIFHGNIIQFIYAFLFNIVLVKAYDKDNNILNPIIIHISANSVVTLLLFIIKKLNIHLSIISFIIFLIIFIITMYKYNKLEQNKNVNISNC